MSSGAPGPRRALLPDQSGSWGSGQSLTASRQLSHALDPIPSKRICFYKSGDPQFGGLRLVINRRTFKSFDALLDSLSTKVPLPFGVRNITTPRGVHAVRTLDQLEDGKSYICSDSRKVKPINLAQARRKLPPWYNARPGTGRRRAVQLARMYNGAGKPLRPVPMVVRMPQRLTVFRNGKPAVRQTVTLQKRSRQSFEVLLESVSELLQFPVLKLHTVDGRRVDGLPALILCSGTVVAAGKEPFKPGNYDVHRPPAPERPPANRLAPRRIRPTHRKKKSMTRASKLRNYSESSQRYFLNQIHKSISESMCDYPHNPTDSIDLDKSHMMESVVETDAETCPDHRTHEQGFCLPKEDDIEKSFRVNQDGSMTVEMKVRLTLKEEETIHWTTTVSRSSVANELLPDVFPEPEPEPEEQESNSPEPDAPETSHPAVAMEMLSNDKPRGDNNYNNEPPPLESGLSNEEGNMEDEVTLKTTIGRAPTPGVRKALTSTESMRANMAETVQEGTVRSSSYRAETEQYRMTQQSSTRPVPKPRRLASMGPASINYRYDSAGMSEVLQIENNGEEVTETVLHIYEQQISQDNFYGNTHYRAQGVSMYGAHYGRPSTSDTPWSMNANVEAKFGRPSTASETVQTWKADSMLQTSDITTCKNVVKNTQKKHDESKDSSTLSPGTGKDKHQNVAHQAHKTSSNTKAIKKHVRWIKLPANGRKQSPPEASKNRKKVKPFSSTGFLKKIYGGRLRPVKTMMKMKKTSMEKEKARPATKHSGPPDVTMECTIKVPNKLLSGDNKKQNVPSARNSLTHQKSIHKERQTHKASSGVSRTMPLPVFNSNSSVINEYVEHWLENSPSQHALCPNDQSQAIKVIKQVGLEGGIPEGSKVNCDRIKPGHTEGETGRQSACEESPLAVNLTKQRIKPLQSVPSLEKTTACDSSTDKVSKQINSSADKTVKSVIKQTPKDTSVCSSAMLYTLSSTSSQTSADRPLSVSPTADQAHSPTDHPKTTPISSHSAEREEPLLRNSSVKRTRLVSNLSFERKMSQRKASAEKSALTRADPLQTTTTSCPVQRADGETLEPNMSIKTNKPIEIQLQRPPHTDCRLSCCTSVSPVSSASDERVSLSTPASSDASYITKHLAKEADSTKTQLLSSPQTETQSPKPIPRKVKVSDLSLEKKLSIRRAQCDASAIPNDPSAEEIPVSSSLSLKRTQLPRNQSLKSASSQKTSLDSSKAKTLNSSPSSESPSTLHKTYSEKKTSPYSQSLDLASPPGKEGTKQNLVNQNLSPDKRSELTKVDVEPLVDVKGNVKPFIDTGRPQGSHEKPAIPKHQNLSDDQKVVHTHQKKHSTTDIKDTLLLQEKQHLSSAPQGSTEDKEVESRNNLENGKNQNVDEQEVQQGSLNKNQPIKSHVPYMDMEDTREESHEENRCSSEGKHVDGESKEHDRNSNDSMFSPEEVSSSDEEWKHHPETQQKLSSPEEQEGVEHRQLKQVRNNMSDYKSLSSSEEEEHKLQCRDRFKRSNINLSSTQETSSRNRPDKEDLTSSEDDQHVELQSRTNTRSVRILAPGDKQIRQKLTKIESLSEEHVSTLDEEEVMQSEKDQAQWCCTVAKSCTSSSLDVAELSSTEKELKEVRSYEECKQMKDIIKEHISGHEEASQGSMVEEEEEDKEEEEDSSVLKQANGLEPGLKLDEDNERDQKSDGGEDERANAGNEKCSSTEDEMSYGQKDQRPEEGHENQEQQVHGKRSPEDSQRVAPQQKAQTAEIMSQSVAERIGLLKKQVAETQWKGETDSIRIQADESTSEVESPTPDTKTTRALPGSRSAPQSSLSFSYDSSSIINRQPEGAMVRSIKEMFMAKSVPDVQCEDGDVRGPISSEPSPASGLPDSDELWDAGSIAKGFVRRTIERLYGRKDPTAGVTPSERPTSLSKQMKEGSSISSSLHSPRSKLQSDMPYFNSTNTFDTLSEATRCTAFNTQVGPGVSLPIDQDRSQVRKSISDPVGLNKALLDKDPSEDTSQKVPVSLFSSNSEPEDKLEQTKCTYFSLPCASDSDQGPEDPGAVSKNDDSSVDIQEDQEEARRGKVPGLRLHDNKVHPLGPQGAPGGQVVVAQPARGQGVVRPVELDALDALYTFCGEHCPIL